MGRSSLDQAVSPGYAGGSSKALAPAVDGPIHGLAVSIRSISFLSRPRSHFHHRRFVERKRLSWCTPEKSIRFRGFTVPIVAGLKNRWKKGKDSNSAPALQEDIA